MQLVGYLCEELDAFLPDLELKVRFAINFTHRGHHACVAQFREELKPQRVVLGVSLNRNHFREKAAEGQLPRDRRMAET